jgi:hypothetical protein
MKSFAKNFLIMTTEAQATKVKVNELGYIKILNFCTKDIINSEKANHGKGENICQLYLVRICYAEYIKKSFMSTKQIVQLKMGKGLTQTLFL